MTFKELAQKIQALSCAHSVRFVAIDGGAGSGKTTFSLQLSKSLSNAPIVQMDDFMSVTDIIGWWPRLEEQVLRPLFAGKSIRYQIRDWVNDVYGNGLGQWVEKPFSPVVILEGVGAARQAVASRLTYSIWIETPVETRIQRGLERDEKIAEPEALWRKWQAMEKDFHQADGARLRANLVVDGTRPYFGENLAFHILQ